MNKPTPKTDAQQGGETATPITDKNECRFSSLFAGEDAMWVHSKIARQLEREAASLRRELADAQKEVGELREGLRVAEEPLQIALDKAEWREANMPAGSYELPTSHALSFALERCRALLRQRLGLQ